MRKPVILAVDDDPDVLNAVAQDLRARYASDYRILKAGSGSAGLEALRKLKLRDDDVALLLLDQRMPRMTGIEAIEQAAELYPEAKRVLLTAYADTDAAIRAINRARLDYYLLKPWDPPDERLYPILDELLEDWRATYRPRFEGLRVIGHRWSPLAHQIKDFLARNQVPYRWLDVEQNEEAQVLMAQLGESPVLPLVLFPDGSHLEQPANSAIADRIGMRRQASRPFYDLAIVGGGPAGLAAAVYGASEGLRTVIVESDAPGGQAGTSSRIENYLGFPAGLSGGDLARRAVAQALKFGTEILSPQKAVGMRRDGPYRILQLSDGKELTCHSLMIATGVAYTRLDIPGLELLADAGVFYGAALTEALSCRGEDVFVIGAGNSAGQAAMYLARFARSVTMLVRGNDLRKAMSQYLVDQIQSTENIAVRLRTVVSAVHGADHLESISLLDADTGAVEEVPAFALFIFIGAAPKTDWLGGVVERDERGFIRTGAELMRNHRPPVGWPLAREPFMLETSVPGVFAAGDVRLGSVKRVASGVGEGAVCLSFIHRYLSEL
jgi:thioredoxin reductase (NADPH)